MCKTGHWTKDLENDAFTTSCVQLYFIVFFSNASNADYVQPPLPQQVSVFMSLRSMAHGTCSHVYFVKEVCFVPFTTKTWWKNMNKLELRKEHVTILHLAT